MKTTPLSTLPITLTPLGNYPSGIVTIRRRPIDRLLRDTAIVIVNHRLDPTSNKNRSLQSAATLEPEILHEVCLSRERERCRKQDGRAK